MRVDDVEWQELPTLFGAGPNDRVYTLRTDEQGKAGSCSATACAARGCRRGVNNVRATYRQGLGQRRQRRRRPADAADDAAARPEGRQPIRCRRRAAPTPSPPTRRGAACRSARARSAAPCRCSTTRTSRSRSPASPRRRRGAAAARRPDDRDHVAGQDGAPIAGGNPIWDDLRTALRRPRRPARADRPAVVPGEHVPARPEGQARPGLRARRPCSPRSRRRCARSYGFDARALGQPVLQSDVIAVAHAVAGVVAVDLDRLYGGTRAVVPGVQVAADAPARLAACASSAASPRAGRAADACIPGRWRGWRRCHDAASTAERLYALLPAVYRIRDAGAGRAAARAGRR